MLSDLQIDRYSRQILLPEIGGIGQERLLAASVRILGSGTIARTAATYLVGAGVGRLEVSAETATAVQDNPDCRVVVPVQRPSTTAEHAPDLVLHAGPYREDGGGSPRRLHRLVARIVSGNAVVVDAGIACADCAESFADVDETDETRDTRDRSLDELAEAIAGGVLAAESIPRLLEGEARPPKRIVLGVRDPGATLTRSLSSLTCSHTFGRDVGEEGRLS